MKSRTRDYAGVLLVSKDGRLLLQRRDKTPTIKNPGMITTFGGSVENGETAEECAIRELEEELGLSLTKNDLLLLLRIDVGAGQSQSIFLTLGVEPKLLSIREGERIEMLSLSECLQSHDLSKLCRMAIEAFKAKYC